MTEILLPLGLFEATLSPFVSFLSAITCGTQRTEKKVAVSSNHLKGPCTLQRLEPKFNQLKFCFERIFMVFKCLQDQEKKAWQSQKPTYAVLIPQNNLPHAVSAPAGYRDFTWSCCLHVTLTTKKRCQKKTVLGLSFWSFGDAGYPMIINDSYPSGGAHCALFCVRIGEEMKMSWVENHGKSDPANSSPLAHRCCSTDGQRPLTESIVQGEHMTGQYQVHLGVHLNTPTVGESA